jgi:hypothetical protein
VADTGVPACNLILTGGKVGFCNREIDAEPEERACSAECGCKLGFNAKSSAVLNATVGIIERDCVTSHH